MTKYSLFFSLISIVYGLMLTELFAGIHKLLRNKKIIQWHWLPLLVVWYVFLIIIKNWWSLAPSGEKVMEINIYIFLAYSHLLLLVYLMVSSALPDAIPAGGLSLKTYYLNNTRYFWSLLIAVNLVSLVLSYLISHQAGRPFNLNNLMVNAVALLIFLVLIFSRKLWVHAVIVIILVLETFLEIVNF